MTDLPDPPASDPRTPRPGAGAVDARALDADERALAERIAAAAPPRGPSAELDARILAMARAPVGADASAPMAGSDRSSTRPAGAAAAQQATSAIAAPSTRRRRWPAMAGIAATLTLAFGLAWQMRPSDPLPMQASEAMSAPSAKAPGAGGPRADDEAGSAMAPARSAASAAADAAAPQAADLAAGPGQPAAPTAIDGVPARRDRAGTAPAAGSRRVQEIAPAPSAAAMEAEAPPQGVTSPIAPAAPAPIDAPSPMSAPPAPAAAPPPPPPPVDARARAGRAANAADPAEAASADAAARSSASGAEFDRIEVTGTGREEVRDQPLDDQPPASAASPAVRDAWLARVRQLLADGRSDDARDSLREYHRRYPDAAIPDDLRALLPPE